MARRMFSSRITESTKFLKMPATSQNLYFHLGMAADDDGIAEAFTVMRMVGASEDDLRVLVSKQFVTVLNEDFVVFLNDWMECNDIRADRKVDSIYLELLLQVFPEAKVRAAKESYYSRTKAVAICQTNDGQISGKCQRVVRISKDSISKDSIDKVNKYSVSFEQFWRAYPRHKEKAKAYKCYHARLNDGYSEHEMLEAAENYAECCRKEQTNERYIKLASTFLGPDMPFTDWIRKDDKDGGENEYIPESSARLW